MSQHTPHVTRAVIDAHLLAAALSLFATVEDRVLCSLVITRDAVFLRAQGHRWILDFQIGYDGAEEAPWALKIHRRHLQMLSDIHGAPNITIELESGQAPDWGQYLDSIVCDFGRGTVVLPGETLILPQRQPVPRRLCLVQEAVIPALYKLLRMAACAPAYKHQPGHECPDLSFVMAHPAGVSILMPWGVQWVGGVINIPSGVLESEPIGLCRQGLGVAAQLLEYGWAGGMAGLDPLRVMVDSQGAVFEWGHARLEILPGSLDCPLDPRGLPPSPSGFGVCLNAWSFVQEVRVAADYDRNMHGSFVFGPGGGRLELAQVDEEVDTGRKVRGAFTHMSIAPFGSWPDAHDRVRVDFRLSALVAILSAHDGVALLHYPAHESDPMVITYEGSSTWATMHSWCPPATLANAPSLSEQQSTQSHLQDGTRTDTVSATPTAPSATLENP